MSDTTKELPPYSASIEVRESGTNQRPSISVTLTTGKADLPSESLVAETLYRYITMYNALHPDKPNTYKITAKASPFV